MAVTGTNTGVWQLTQEGDSIDGTMIIEGVRWIGTSTGAAADVCKITYNSGKPLFNSIANGANFVDAWIMNSKWISTLTVASLSSGLVHVYEAVR